MHKAYSNHDRLLTAVDCIIFGFDEKKLKVLLIKRNFEPAFGQWSLMGGFVQRSESLDEAAIRILYRLTGLTDIYMEQLGCFGAIDRDPVERVMSVAYFALINVHKYAKALQTKYEAQWFDINEVPDLIFDHNEMMATALLKLRNKAQTQPIGFALLPQKFTLPELHQLYESIYGEELDKRNFNRRILSSGLLRKLDEKQKGTSKKGAFFYVFDEDKYHEYEEAGFTLDLV